VAPVCSNCGASDFVWANDLKTGGLGGGSLSLRSRGELSLGTRVCRSCGHADLFLKDPSVLRMPHTWRPGEFTPIPSHPAPAHALSPPVAPSPAANPTSPSGPSHPAAPSPHSPAHATPTPPAPPSSPSPPIAPAAPPSPPAPVAPPPAPMAPPAPSGAPSGPPTAAPDAPAAEGPKKPARRRTSKKKGDDPSAPETP